MRLHSSTVLERRGACAVQTCRPRYACSDPKLLALCLHVCVKTDGAESRVLPRTYDDIGAESRSRPSPCRPGVRLQAGYDGRGQRASLGRLHQHRFPTSSLPTSHWRTPSPPPTGPPSPTCLPPLWCFSQKLDPLHPLQRHAPPSDPMKQRFCIRCWCIRVQFLWEAQYPAPFLPPAPLIFTAPLLPPASLPPHTPLLYPARLPTPPRPPSGFFLPPRFTNATCILVT